MNAPYTMPKTCLIYVSAIVFILAAFNSYGTTAWKSTSSGDWTLVANWTNNPPSVGPQLAIYPGTATLQKSITLGGSIGRETLGMQFTLTAGGVGYTFTGLPAVSGFFALAGGSVNGIVNNDDSTQTFNVPIKLMANGGLPGPGAAMTWNAAAGSMVFNGNNTAPATPWTINLNGASALTIDGAFNVSVGTSGPGQIVNTEAGPTGIVKNGTGTLYLGGTAANTFSGVNMLNAGKITAGKANALGAGNALIMGGGTFETGGFSQTLGTLDLDGLATLDFGSGASAVSFANSSSLDWGSAALTIFNWTDGTDTLRFGTDSTGLNAFQLSKLSFDDIEGFDHAEIDSNGYILLVIPEPSATAMIGLGLSLFLFARRKSLRES